MKAILSYDAALKRRKPKKLLWYRRRVLIDISNEKTNTSKRSALEDSTIGIAISLKKEKKLRAKNKN